MGREKRSCDGMAGEGRASLAGRGRAHEDGGRWWTVERRLWYVAGVVGVFSGSTRREPCGGGGMGASCAARRRDGGEGGVRRDGGGEGRRGCSEGAQKVSGPAACMTSRTIGKVGAPGAVRLSAPCWTAPLICPLTINTTTNPRISRPNILPGLETRVALRPAFWAGYHIIRCILDPWPTAGSSGVRDGGTCAVSMGTYYLTC